ncbi:hypothetical protein BDQ12DRAFT_727571 [Crucibulum laeve]|uniref:Uncharacterized protein n=1 Tax=Crucibulum laeve TaxID=68775 RepID=A0A5C3LKH9_9AGAR|nr:hypothetical protein BDQ12DRAFT_727571 [Crucibulum laeve]
MSSRLSRIDIETPTGMDLGLYSGALSNDLIAIISIYPTSLSAKMGNTTVEAAALAGVTCASILYGSQPFTPAQYWLNTGQPIQIFSSTVCFANTIVGDAVLIWRLYVVWNKSLLISIPPIMTLLASTISGSIMIGLLAQDIYGTINRLGLTTWSLSIGTQVFTTGFICWKIWNVGALSASPPKQYAALIRVIIESGAIYSGLAVVLLIMYGLGEHYSIVLMGCMGPLSAIIPALIIIRVHWNRDDAIHCSESADVRNATSMIRFESNAGLHSNSKSIEEITKA